MFGSLIPHKLPANNIQAVASASISNNLEEEGNTGIFGIFGSLNGILKGMLRRSIDMGSQFLDTFTVAIGMLFGGNIPKFFKTMVQVVQGILSRVRNRV